MTKGKVKEASDYYGVAANQVIVAFGSEMRARTSGAQSRFGFNGKKKIDEITNIQGSDYDFDFLINRKEISEVCGTGEGYTCNEKITIKSVKDIVLINVQEYFKNDSSGHVIPGTYKKIISKSKFTINKLGLISVKTSTNSIEPPKTTHLGTLDCTPALVKVACVPSFGETP